MEKLLTTEKLCVGYGKNILIRDLALKVRKGEIVTLIGPNGSGKSTILKSIIGELALMGGTVSLCGRDMAEMTEKERAKKLSVLMTDRISPEYMTCREVAEAGRYPYTGILGILSEEDKEIVRKALHLVHAEELADRDFSKISDGQKQRILLARAIAQEPEVIVLDEPTSYLDIRHKMELVSILKNLVRDKKTGVLMSLHEIELAQKVSDMIICIKGEQVTDMGTPEEIFQSDRMKKLYDVEAGTYLPEYGIFEMEAVGGTPEVFVIGGNGSGIPVYRELQRKGIPFVCGVIHENDQDYPIARALAVKVISQGAFEMIREETLKEAKEWMKRCRKVICPLSTFGPMNERNKELKETAEKWGKLDERMSEL